jgi:hypothetical protein
MPSAENDDGSAAFAEMAARLMAISERREAHEQREATADRVGHFLLQLDISHINEMFARWGEYQAREIIVEAGDTEAGIREGQALLQALAIEAASRIGRALRALYRPGALDAESREVILDGASTAFRRMLSRSIALDVPLADIVAEEREERSAEAAEASTQAAEAFADAVRTGAGWTHAGRRVDPASVYAEPTEQPDMGAAGVGQVFDPQPIDPRAEQSTPAADVTAAEAAQLAAVAAYDPDGKPGAAGAPAADTKPPRTMKDALDAIRAAEAKRVHRHDESGISGPTVGRIETDGERG